MNETKKLIGLWESRSRRYWVRLYEHRNTHTLENAYSFHADGAAGYIGKTSLEQAVRRAELEASFSPFKCKRVKGCGTPFYAAGTNGGTMPCGGTLNWGDHTTIEYCHHCEKLP